LSRGFSTLRSSLLRRTGSPAERTPRWRKARWNFRASLNGRAFFRAAGRAPSKAGETRETPAATKIDRYCRPHPLRQERVSLRQAARSSGTRLARGLSHRESRPKNPGN